MYNVDNITEGGFSMKKLSVIFSIFLILCLTVGMIPTPVHAEEPCTHIYDIYGNCTLCDYFCPHQWAAGHCDLCGCDCQHDYVDMVCTICSQPCPHAWQDDTCPLCGGICSHSYEMGYCTSCGAEDPNFIHGDTQTATLVTDASDLTVGDRIIIAAAGYDYALSTTQNTNNRGQSNIAKDGITATFGTDTQVITLESGAVEGTFALSVEDGKYLYAPSSSANNLKTQSSLNNNGSWHIAIGADGNAAITAAGSSTRNILRYNATSSLFSCYAASNNQKDVAIYMLERLHTHSYEATVTAPTCEAGGYTTYTCPCGDSYVAEEVAALGHRYEKGVCGNCGAIDPNYDPQVIPTLQAAGFTLSFEDEILVNLYYTVSHMTDVAEQGMLVFYTDPGAADIAKADDVYTGSKYVESSESYMNTTKGIAAKEMGDERYYCAYAKLTDGTYAYSPLYQYSPKKYAMSRIQNSTDESMKALCVAMLNYGAAAQEYFGYRTDDLMNAGLTDAQKALVKAYDAAYFNGAAKADTDKMGFFAATGGFSGASVSVSFEGAFAINYYFLPSSAVDGEMKLYIWNPDTYTASNVLTAENASEVINMDAQEGGAYWGQVSGIAAKMLDETYYVAAVYTDAQGNTQSTGVIGYSLSQYCLNNAKSGRDMESLAGATAMYGYYAKAYFAK